MMSPDARLKSAAPIFAALGDVTRLRLVGYLSTVGPASTTALTEHVDVTRQAVAKHLQVMRQAGLVRGLLQGRARVWQIEPVQLLEAQRCLQLVSARWDRALGRLKTLVEND